MGHMKSKKILYIFFMPILVLSFSGIAFLIFLLIPNFVNTHQEVFSRLKPSQNEPKASAIQVVTPPPHRIERFKINEDNPQNTTDPHQECKQDSQTRDNQTGPVAIK